MRPREPGRGEGPLPVRRSAGKSGSGTVGSDPSPGPAPARRQLRSAHFLRAPRRRGTAATRPALRPRLEDEVPAVRLPRGGKPGPVLPWGARAAHPAEPPSAATCPARDWHLVAARPHVRPRHQAARAGRRFYFGRVGRRAVAGPCPPRGSLLPQPGRRQVSPQWGRLEPGGERQRAGWALTRPAPGCGVTPPGESSPCRNSWKSSPAAGLPLSPGTVTLKGSVLNSSASEMAHGKKACGTSKDTDTGWRPLRLVVRSKRWVFAPAFLWTAPSRRSSGSLYCEVSWEAWGFWKPMLMAEIFLSCQGQEARSVAFSAEE